MGDRIVIASDHRGVRLKAALRQRLEAGGHPVQDLGPQGDGAVDYPDFAARAARAVSTGEVPRGIVICGSGLGVMYTANRFAGVRAALVQDEETGSTPSRPGSWSRPGSRHRSRAGGTRRASRRSTG